MSLLGSEIIEEDTSAENVVGYLSGIVKCAHDMRLPIPLEAVDELYEALNRWCVANVTEYRDESADLPASFGH